MMNDTLFTEWTRKSRSVSIFLWAESKRFLRDSRVEQVEHDIFYGILI